MTTSTIDPRSPSPGADRRRFRLRPPTGEEQLVGVVVVFAWAAAAGALVTGHGDLLDHGALLDRPAWPAPLALLGFLAVWQVMTAAMMLPTSVPMLRLFVRASASQPRHRAAVAAFVGAYFAVWTGFAVVALAGDLALHRLVAQWPALAARPGVIAGLALVAAGAFQFSPLKEQCLRACRHPMSYLMRHYARGPRAAWRLGLRHGLFCLGCCWALMLVMFAVGAGNLAVMAALTGVMLVEKTQRWGRRLVPVVGIALFGLAVWLVFGA